MNPPTEDATTTPAAAEHWSLREDEGVAQMLRALTSSIGALHIGLRVTATAQNPDGGVMLELPALPSAMIGDLFLNAMRDLRSAAGLTTAHNSPWTLRVAPPVIRVQQVATALLAMQGAAGGAAGAAGAPKRRLFPDEPPAAS